MDESLYCPLPSAPANRRAQSQTTPTLPPAPLQAAACTAPCFLHPDVGLTGETYWSPASSAVSPSSPTLFQYFAETSSPSLWITSISFLPDGFCHRMDRFLAPHPYQNVTHFPLQHQSVIKDHVRSVERLHIIDGCRIEVRIHTLPDDSLHHGMLTRHLPYYVRNHRHRGRDLVGIPFRTCARSLLYFPTPG